MSIWDWIRRIPASDASPPPAPGAPPDPPRVAETTELALAETRRVVDAIVVPSRAEDSFANLVTGLGTSSDKRMAGGFTIVIPLALQQLNSMYRGSWLARRIVDAPAEDACREWCDLSWDGRDEDEGTVKSVEEAERLFNFRGKVLSAYKWGRLYGGAGIVMGIKGQKDWSQPLDLDTVTKDSLELLHVLDRWRLAATGQVDTDRTSPNFGQPLYYTIAEAAESVALVHWTRIVIFRGKEIPYFEWQRNGRWHDSVLQDLTDNIRDYEATRAGIAAMVDESNVDILSIPNLTALISTPGGRQKLIDRVNLGAMLKGTNRVWLHDGGSPDLPNSGEKYDQKVTQFSGVNGVYESVAVRDICGAAEIPATRLFGDTPGGLQSTGKGEQETYDTRIRRDQTAELTRPVMMLYEVLIRSVLGSMPKNFGITWKPITAESAGDKADRELKRAQRDTAYELMGAITADVVTRELKDDGVYRTLEDKDVALAKKLALQPEPATAGPGAKKPQPVSAKPT